MAISGAAVAYTTIGGLLVFSGIKGSTIQSTVSAVLTGNLGGLQDTETIDFGSSSGGTSSGSSGNESVAAGASQTTWNKDLLSALGAPATSANLASLADWQAHEEPTSDWSHWNNPMNTTMQEPGSQSENSVGVQSYPSLSVGLTATVSTLNNGDYGDIIMLLKSGQGLKSGASAGLSKWSGGGYSSV